MAITTAGFAGPITSTQWGTMTSRMSLANGNAVVSSGLDVTGTGSARQVSISAGNGWAGGISFDSSSASTLTLDAQSSGTRRDFIVLRLTWATKTAVFAIVKGTSSSTPSTTQNIGSVFEVPLATVDVTSASGVFTSSNIIARKPLPRVSRFFTASSFTYRNGMGSAASPLEVTTLVVGDPGWPYRLRCDAAAVFTSANSGAATVQVAISGSTNTPFITGRSDPLNSTTTAGHPARASGFSDLQTGNHGVVFSVQPADLLSGDSVSMITGNSTMFHVEQIPA